MDDKNASDAQSIRESHLKALAKVKGTEDEKSFHQAIAWDQAHRPIATGLLMRIDNIDQTKDSWEFYPEDKTKLDHLASSTIAVSIEPPSMIPASLLGEKHSDHIHLLIDRNIL